MQAHVFVKSEIANWTWAHGALVSQRLAIVHPRHDNLVRAQRLWALEEAPPHVTRRGLWAEPSLQVGSAEDLIREETVLPDSCRKGPNFFVQGVVYNAQATERGVWINFCDPGEESSDLTLPIDPRAAAAGVALGLTPKAGKPKRHVRVKATTRSKVGARGGALICIAHPPVAIEFLSR